MPDRFSLKRAYVGTGVRFGKTHGAAPPAGDHVVKDCLFVCAVIEVFDKVQRAAAEYGEHVPCDRRSVK